MKARIKLPDEPLIDYLFFCKAIAQAICPAGEQELKGVDCIVDKQVTRNIALPVSTCKERDWSTAAALQGALAFADELDASSASTTPLPFEYEVRQDLVEITLPFELNEDDRQLLANLLANLPALHYPMSEEEIAAFMRAYLDLPNRPAWEPILITAADIERRRAKQDELMRKHQKALQDELACGRVVAVDFNHVPVVRFAMDTFLPRDQAIAYLNRCGIIHSDKLMDGQHAAESQAPIAPAGLSESRGSVGARKLSDKQRQEAVALRDELERAGVKNFRQQVATKFGISPRYVQKLVAKETTRQSEDRIENLIVKRRK